MGGGTEARTLGGLDEATLRGKRALVRVDFNVPLGPSGTVEDDTRMKRSLPTLRHLVDAGARVILLSHLGRPGGRPDPSLSMRPMADRLGELLGRPVGFVDEPVGDVVTQRVEALGDGDVLMLENTRFVPGETANDPALARAWAALGDLFVQDAFGTAHRSHASTVGLPEAIRAKGGLAVEGFLVEEELRFLAHELQEPKRPYVAVMGGAKISGKIDVVEALLSRVDRLLIGGAMANTFFRALGLETGRSRVEEDRVEMARDLLDRAAESLLLPVDCVVASTIEEGARTRIALRSELGVDEAIGDVGPATRELFRSEVLDAATVVWNGPLGVFEIDVFSGGTLAMARAVAEASDRGALTVVGGGDSAAAAEKAGVADRITHVSTGGGAFLDVLAGSTLPGIAALSQDEAS